MLVWEVREGGREERVGEGRGGEGRGGWGNNTVGIIINAQQLLTMTKHSAWYQSTLLGPEHKCMCHVLYIITKLSS